MKNLQPEEEVAKEMEIEEQRREDFKEAKVNSRVKFISSFSLDHNSFYKRLDEENSIFFSSSLSSFIYCNWLKHAPNIAFLSRNCFTL